ncbi:MAG: hypothetical protein QNJ63_02710 [Calothrix sp. MO_192.B10]|nr:hypothetical protein [Calothrix sp. MO_192.B10]
MVTITRPKNLDKRVFFGDDCPGYGVIAQNDLLYLRVHYRGKNKFKWLFEFDILESGKTGGSVAFTKDEFCQIIQILESKNFDWRERSFPEHYPSIILYRYLNLEDVIEIVNQVADFAYRLHNDLNRKPSISEINQLSYIDQSRHEIFRVHIHDQIKGQYQLCFPQELDIDILLFKEGRISFKTDKKIKFDFRGEYTYEQAIEDYNPEHKNGILLVYYQRKIAELYEMEWNEFCLMIDRRIFDKTDIRN